MLSNNIFKAAAVLSASLVWTSVSQAAWVNIGGDNFDISYDDAVINEFGTPTIINNTIVFTPNDMVVERGLPESWTTSVIVTPHEGVELANLQITEQGDYARLISTTGVDSYLINTNLYLRDLQNPNSTLTTHTATESFGESNLAFFENWTLNDAFDIADYSDGFLLTIQNTLWAFTPGAVFSDAEILLYKKYVGIDLGRGLVTNPIPVPAASWLFLSAIGGLMVVRRK